MDYPGTPIRSNNFQQKPSKFPWDSEILEVFTLSKECQEYLADKKKMEKRIYFIWEKLVMKIKYKLKTVNKIRDELGDDAVVKSIQLCKCKDQSWGPQKST